MDATSEGSPYPPSEMPPLEDVPPDSPAEGSGDPHPIVLDGAYCPFSDMLLFPLLCGRTPCLFSLDNTLERCMVLSRSLSANTNGAIFGAGFGEEGEAEREPTDAAPLGCHTLHFRAAQSSLASIGGGDRLFSDGTMGVVCKVTGEPYPGSVRFALRNYHNTLSFCRKSAGGAFRSMLQEGTVIHQTLTIDMRRAAAPSPTGQTAFGVRLLIGGKDRTSQPSSCVRMYSSSALPPALLRRRELAKWASDSALVRVHRLEVRNGSRVLWTSHQSLWAIFDVSVTTTLLPEASAKSIVETIKTAVQRLDPSTSQAAPIWELNQSPVDAKFAEDLLSRPCSDYPEVVIWAQSCSDSALVPIVLDRDSYVYRSPEVSTTYAAAGLPAAVTRKRGEAYLRFEQLANRYHQNDAMVIGRSAIHGRCVTLDYDSDRLMIYDREDARGETSP